MTARIKAAAKPLHRHSDALRVAEELMGALGPGVERIHIAGSLRRLRPMVGDIELVFIPRMELDPLSDIFNPTSVSVADGILEALLTRKIIAKRKNSGGSEMWGDKNKLGLHCASGIPVDFFATTESAWWNYLTCRTGGAETNKAIAMAAQARGWKWHPYGDGFTDENDRPIIVANERAVFELVGLPYREPHQRR